MNLNKTEHRKAFFETVLKTVVLFAISVFFKPGYFQPKLPVEVEIQSLTAYENMADT